MSNNRKDNVSKVFLFPGIEVKDDLKFKFNSFGFINTYLQVQPLTYPYPVIFLLFKPESFNIDFNNFVSEIQKNPNFIEIVDLFNGRILMTFRVPKKFTKDYYTFLEGKYSKLSAAFKSCFSMEKIKVDEKKQPIKKNGKLEKEPTNYYHIFNRTQFMKEHIKTKYNVDDDVVENIEFYDKQDPEQETLVTESDEIW